MSLRSRLTISRVIRGASRERLARHKIPPRVTSVAKVIGACMKKKLTDQPR